MKDLQDQLAIGRQEVRLLGRRTQQVEPEETNEIEQAVTNQILARRKTSANTEAPIRVQEKRAYEKEATMAMVRDHQELLISWDEILEACLAGLSLTPPGDSRRVTSRRRMSCRRCGPNWP